MSHFQNLQSQMTEFEANAEPLQEWLNSTEVRVQESSARLHDLSAKKQELSKLQVLWSPESRSLAEFSVWYSNQLVSHQKPLKSGDH